MQNAHLRLGRLQYTRNTEKTNTQISVHVDYYISNGEQAHLLSFFGGDVEVGAIRAAIYEKHTFTLTFPDGATKHLGLGPDAVCYNGALSLPGAKRALRHLIAVSAPQAANGTAGQTFIVNLDQETKELTWATVVSLLGLPADPRWGNVVLGEMRKEKRIRLLDGIGCKPAVINGTREELMARIGQARAAGLLPFPQKNGPMVWPNYALGDVFATSRSIHELEVD
ncbi:MAG TPA: hypothetical protein VK638_56825 [Edaphobacter sp.]|nr:hypothetical protein [Edaphobacter sp.]